MYFSEREQMDYDVCIVGGGPAGLSTAIKIKQLQQDISVCVLEKGAEIGSHILSGNCFESKSFDLLFKDWRTMNNPPPIQQQVKQEYFRINLTKERCINLPHFIFPKTLQNQKNHIISLGKLTEWMGEQASDLGVDIITGFAADKLVFQDEKVKGIITKDFGVDKEGQKTDQYEPGVQINSKLLVLAEGARGSLSEQIIEKYNLRQGKEPQQYGIGIKEIWEVPKGTLKAGLLEHTLGWPTPTDTYAGGFMYAISETELHLGYIVGLDYQNPYINPYEEFQMWKTSKNVRKYLTQGKCIKYGARVINSGGYNSLPKLTFPGGILVGCSAGFVDVLKIKGVHNAIKSGVIAAEVINDFKDQLDQIKELKDYQTKIDSSEIIEELKYSKYFKNGFKGGMWKGLINGAFITFFGKALFKNQNSLKSWQYTQEAKNFQEIDYPKHDGKITFDILESVSRSDTYHDHNTPSHLKVKQNQEKSWINSLNNYAGYEQRYCPAKVYEFVEQNGKKELQINSQNCVHCKTCSIKSFEEYLDWTVPQGGEGPQYKIM